MRVRGALSRSLPDPLPHRHSRQLTQFWQLQPADFPQSFAPRLLRAWKDSPLRLEPQLDLSRLLSDLGVPGLGVLGLGVLGLGVSGLGRGER